MSQSQPARQKKDANKALIEILRLVDDASSGGALICDPQGTLIYASEAFLTASGLTVTDLSAACPTAVTPAGMLPAAGATAETSHAVCIPRPDGSEYHDTLAITPIHDAAGTLRYLVARIPAPSRRNTSSPTNLPPRGYTPDNLDFTRCLIDALETPEASQHGLVILSIEIDGFAALEQNTGEDALAALIDTLTLRIKKTLRQIDHLLYLGKGRLLILISPNPATEAHTAHDISERLLVVIRASLDDLDAFPALPARVTASIGVSRHPLDGNTAAALIEHAVAAMHHAQQQGGNIACHADTQPAGSLPAEGRKLLNDLPFAISRDEMVLHYQPQMNLLSGEIVGMEALIRWQHPEHGLMFPGRFIPLAEQSSHIVRLGNWVIRAACRQLSIWRDAGIPVVKVAINLSTQHFLEENLPATIQRTLEEYGIEPRLLEVEITEGAMMQDFTLATRSIHQLKEIGIRISLDDFGTGYSSMSYLSRFPIDVVKIDQSFIRDITTNPVNATIAQATIALSHQLNKIVLAEGVETEEQMRYLRKNECDEMQGYFFSKPLPANEIALLLREDRRINLEECADSATRGTVLIVDDEANVLAALKRVLRKQGYELLTAGSAAEGFDLLAKYAIHVVVTDHQMPEMSGTEFLARVKTLHPRTVRMLLTGNSDIATVTDAINKGAAYRFMLKPWQDDILKSEIAAALRYWRELYGQEPRAHTG